MAWPTSNFPTALDAVTDKVDNVDDVIAADINGVFDCIKKIQAKIGIDSSAEATSLDYLVKNSSSSNPGHKHTLAHGATDVTASAAEVNLLDGSSAGVAVASKALVLGANKNVDTLVIADGGLKLGADAGTAITATAAEINTACDGSTAKNSHTHTPDDASISQAKLKTSQGAVNTNSSVGANLTLPGGEYGFYPQVCGAYLGSAVPLDARIGVAVSSAAWVTNIWLRDANTIGLTATVYAAQRYVTSSGEVFWTFYLRDKVTKRVLSSYAAPDHPCFGNGGKPALVPHPFLNYDPKKHEIVVINPTLDEMAAIIDRIPTPDVIHKSVSEIMGYDDNAAIEFEDTDGLWTMKPSEVVALHKEVGISSAVTFRVIRPDRSILEVIMEDMEVNDISKATVPWVDKPVTVGLPPIHDGQAMDPVSWKKVPDGTPIVPVKSMIPRPRLIETRKLVLKQ